MARISTRNGSSLLYLLLVFMLTEKRIQAFQQFPLGPRFVISTSTSPAISTSSAVVQQQQKQRNNVSLQMSSDGTTTTTTTTMNKKWSDLQSEASAQVVGSTLDKEVGIRKDGYGSAHVQSNLRLFSDKEKEMPKLTLYRDHAGWCPYCQKTMLLIEEKQIPIKIEVVPMRSYGDKPPSFMRLVPNGLLPALGVEDKDGKQQIITESQVIMELLDRWHPPSEGYKQMLPNDDDTKGKAKYDRLARLERELFSWWCTLIFRPEGPRMSMPGGSSGGLMGMLTGKNSNNNKKEMSGAMKGFLECMTKVDNELTSTKGPWFYGSDQFDYPTMIDFVYVSHVERMLASCASWKGLNLRSDEMKKEYPGLNAWLDAFEKRECYLAFKSDYYTHVKDIPPQYGPGYDGGFEEERQKYSQMIDGEDGSWSLPLPHDDELQPLYRGPPLPLCVLESVGITPDDDGTYEKSNPDLMAKACRNMAGWKLAGNGENVARFAARGGSEGANNPRQRFGAELADPYAAPDKNAQPYVDAALRIVCQGLLGEEDSQDDHMIYLNTALKDSLRGGIPSEKIEDVQNSLAYLRDRVGCPRDLPLASGRTFRAHLNWAIDSLN